MKIVKEGLNIVIISAVVFFLSLYLVKISRWFYVLLFLSLVISIFALYFFRDPSRERVFSMDEIPSPADGKIISIKEELPDVIVIRIFLSIFDVHLQRSPIDGKIKEIDFTYGKFHIAYKPEAKDNQRNMIKIEKDELRWAWVEQITGAIARRIACYVKKDEVVKKGDKIGMIYFGSQVALYLPKKEVDIKVNIGDKVRAKEDVIAIWRRKQ